VYIWLFDAGQDRAEVAGAVDSGTDEVADDVDVDVDDDDALDAADETLLPDDPPDILIAEIVLLPAVV
jgi:hypothetical protein